MRQDQRPLPHRPVPSLSDSPALRQRVRRALVASRRKVILIVDEVTGTQAVGGVPMVVESSAAAIATALSRNPSATALLAATRDLSPEEAAAKMQRLGADSIAAGYATRGELKLLQRLDPLLAGHIVVETQAIAERFGGFDGVLVVPAFFDGGFYTLDSIQWLRDGNRLTPLARRGLESGPRFPVREPDLRRWLEAGAPAVLAPGNVEGISLDEVRGSRDRLARRLRHLQNGQYVVVDAGTMDDLYRLLLACLVAERDGARLLYRAGPSLVHASTTRDPAPSLRAADLFGSGERPGPGLVLLGPPTPWNRGLRDLLRRHPTVLDLVIEPALESATRRQVLHAHHFRHLCGQVADALASGLTPLLSFQAPTSFDSDGDISQFRQACARTMSDMVRTLPTPPSWLIVESGTVATAVTHQALEVRRAEVIGQVGTGITAWRLDTSDRLATGVMTVVTPEIADHRIIWRLLP